MATVAPRAPSHGGEFSREEKKVIFASSLGTVFEWYDFYLYAVLAPFFAAVFFPPGNATAALLSAFATYAAGFLVRPFGALVFGRVGDLVGRKYTFLVTIVVMGFSTFAVGLLPTFSTIGWAAPILLVSLRLLQGLALGGEYGGAATYVAEHAAEGKRGYDTAWIQTTATLGLFLALIIIGLCRFTGWLTPAQFSDWGWRLPFLVSLIVLRFQTESLVTVGILVGVFFLGAGLNEVLAAYIEKHGKLRSYSEYRQPPHIQWDDAKYQGDAYGTYAWAVYVAVVIALLL